MFRQGRTWLFISAILVLAQPEIGLSHDNPYLLQSERILSFLKDPSLEKSNCFEQLVRMYDDLSVLQVANPIATPDRPKFAQRLRRKARNDRPSFGYSVYDGFSENNPGVFPALVAENLYLASLHFSKHLRIWHAKGLLSLDDKTTIASLRRVIHMAIAESLFYQTVIVPKIRDGSIFGYRGFPHDRGEPIVFYNRDLIPSFSMKDKRGYPIVEAELPDTLAALTRSNPNIRAVSSLIATVPGGEGFLADSVFAHATLLYRVKSAAEFRRRFPHIARTQYTPSGELDLSGGEFVRPESYIESGTQIRRHHGTMHLLADKYAYIEFVDWEKTLADFTDWKDLSLKDMRILDDGITPILDLIEAEAAKNTFIRYDSRFNGDERDDPLSQYCSGLVRTCVRHGIKDPRFQPLLTEEIQLWKQFHDSTQIKYGQKIFSPSGLLGPEAVPLVFGVEPVKAHEANLSNAALTALLGFLIQDGYEVNRRRQAQVAWVVATIARNFAIPLRARMRDLPPYRASDWQRWLPIPGLLSFLQENSSNDISPEVASFNLLLDAAAQHLYRRLKDKEIVERIRNPGVHHAPYLFNDAVKAATEILQEELQSDGKLARLLSKS